jgi:DNA-binding LytR/AlgR family response regulator
MRRLPAIAATLLLLLLARPPRATAAAAAFEGDERAALLRHAPSIRWIRAADNYLELHLDGRVVTLRLTMRQASASLEPLGFVRIHRSFIVARDKIQAVRRDSVRLRDGTELPVGPSFAGRLQA